MGKFSLNTFRKKGKQKSRDNRNYMPANKTAKEITQRKFGLRGKSHLIGILAAASIGTSLIGCDTYPAGSPEAYAQEAMLHRVGAIGMRSNAIHADSQREAEGYLLGAAAADILAQDSTLKARIAAGRENAQYIGDSNVQAAGIIASGMQQTPYFPQRAEPRIYDPEKKQMFMRLDFDRNNLLSWDELGGSYNLQNLDINSDGWVDDNEFNQARPQIYVDTEGNEYYTDPTGITHYTKLNIPKEVKPYLGDDLRLMSTCRLGPDNKIYSYPLSATINDRKMERGETINNLQIVDIKNIYVILKNNEDLYYLTFPKE